MPKETELTGYRYAEKLDRINSVAIELAEKGAPSIYKVWLDAGVQYMPATEEGFPTLQVYWRHSDALMHQHRVMLRRLNDLDLQRRTLMKQCKDLGLRIRHVINEETQQRANG